MLEIGDVQCTDCAPKPHFPHFERITKLSLVLERQRNTSCPLADAGFPQETTITLPDGETVALTKFAAGKSTMAWRSGSDVYLQIQRRDPSRELLADLSGTNKHFPKITKRLNLNDAEYFWYSELFYGPLVVGSEAWEQYTALHQVQDQSIQHCVNHMVKSMGQERALAMLQSDASSFEWLNQAFMHTVIASALPADLKSAVVSLSKAVSDYARKNSVWFQWDTTALTPENLAVDSNGNLVLLDPLSAIVGIATGLDKF